MKKIYSVVLLMITLLSSCNQDIVYSCDKSTNDWVYDNLNTIQVMTRSDWNRIEEKLKIPVYRAFTIEQKVAFWNEKLTDVLLFEWSDNEKTHIQSLITFINEHQHFLNGYALLSDKEKNTFDLYFHQWISTAKNNFKWNRKLLYAILASGHSLLDNKGTLAISPNRKTLLSSTESDCNCSTESDWCSPNSWDCQNTLCVETNHGCGTLLVYGCNGRCGGY